MLTDQRYRLPAGGFVDRDRPIEFSFDGLRYVGCAGDTLASALLANGVRMVGRGFKYHRPRGILSDGSEEPNALVQIDTGAATTPNVRATRQEIYEGLVAAPQNCWPTLGFDVGEVNNFLSALIPAGFYYKTFMWPERFWMRYEYFIRKAAGLGRAPSGADPDTYEKTHAHCDVLIAGGGPAGLAAALAAGRAGARVILVDEQAALGGFLLGRKLRIDDAPAIDWVRSTEAELAAMEHVTVLTRATVAGYYDHNYLTAVERLTDHLPIDRRGDSPRERLWKIRARQVVLASGSHERPLVFADNDRPGVMLASAAQAYVNRYAVRPGDAAVVLTNNDGAYDAAIDLADSGIQVTVADVRRAVPESALEALHRRGVEVLPGHAIAAVQGSRAVRGVDVAPLDDSAGGFAGAPRRLRCDLVCMSGGWSPAVHLFSQSRGRLAWDPSRACFVPGESVQAERSAGACNGTFDLAFVLSEGHEAGKTAAAAAGFRKRGGSASPKVETRQETPLEPTWLLPTLTPGARPSKHFVDFQNDVTAADLQLAVREGYRSVEHLKRYTTTGMGTDQGKTSNVNALAILAGIVGADVSAVGTTTFRPPYTPVTFGAFAGRDVGELADPIRRTPMHEWHVERGARFEDVGQWKRPWYYPRGDESMDDAVARECLAARDAVAILDASTLGRIEVRGPDAAEFLDRIYTNGWKRLAIGRCRYGLMCGEDGMVFDDGVTMRVGEDRYLMHTTSGGAARVLAWLEEWLQTEWPDLDVYCTSVTEQWATASIAGPLARRLLADVAEGVDLSTEAFPFMSWRDARVAGIEARVARVSFTGELSYEVNVPSDYGLALWTSLMRAGERYGITPYGTEAMHVLRAEKGFIIAGQDTDGSVTPIDLGMDWIVSKHKDFIGKRSLARADCLREDRKQLVGLLTERSGEVLPEGGQIVDELRPQPPMRMIGHVTSSYRSPSLGRSIALGLVRGGRSRIGDIVSVPLDREVLTARITEPRFYDPEGERMHG